MTDFNDINNHTKCKWSKHSQLKSKDFVRFDKKARPNSADYKKHTENVKTHIN